MKKHSCKPKPNLTKLGFTCKGVLMTGQNYGTQYMPMILMSHISNETCFTPAVHETNK